MNPDAGQVTDGDITIDSNHETTEQISIAFQDDPPPPNFLAEYDIFAHFGQGEMVLRPTDRRRQHCAAAVRTGHRCLEPYLECKTGGFSDEVLFSLR